MYAHAFINITPIVPVAVLYQYWTDLLFSYLMGSWSERKKEKKEKRFTYVGTNFSIPSLSCRKYLAQILSSVM